MGGARIYTHGGAKECFADQALIFRRHLVMVRAGQGSGRVRVACGLWRPA